ncbi:MAG: hypothetical protein ACRD1R_05485, partial [Acidobacteriota bacterium]
MNDLSKGLPKYLSVPRPVQLLGKAMQPIEWHQRWKSLRDTPLLPRCAVDEWGFIDEHLIQSAAQMQRRSGPQALVRSLAMEGYRPFLGALREYARTLHNFHFQVPDVLRHNASVKKGTSAAGNRNQYAGPRSNNSSSEETNFARLATVNLSDARAALPQLQVAFRDFLSHFSDSKRLDDLERRENALFTTVWPMWYAFALHPEQVLHNPSSDCLEESERIFRHLKRNVRRELGAFANMAELRVEVKPEGVRWEADPMLWLNIDGEDALKVYQSIEGLLTAVLKGIQKIGESELRH